jgi:hypothetical protein
MTNRIIPLRSEPSREIADAAHNLMAAFIRQYPRAGRQLLAGFKVSISTPSEVLLEVHGQVDPASGPSGLLTLGGS